MEAERQNAELEASAVAIAISGARSRRAVKWAAENLIPRVSRVILLHVIPPLCAIPNPGGEDVTPVELMPQDVVEIYKKELLLNTKRKLTGFKRLCSSGREAEIVVLFGEHSAVEILRFVSSNGVKNLVLGASTFSWFTRTVKGTDVPAYVLKSAPDDCNIFLVSRWKLEFKLASRSLRYGTEPTKHIRKVMFKMSIQRELSRSFAEQISRNRSLPVESQDRTLGISRLNSMPPELNRALELHSNFHHIESHVSTDGDNYPRHARQNSKPAPVMPPIGEELHCNLNNNWLGPRRYRAQSLEVIRSDAIDSTKQCEDLEEVERLRTDLVNTLAMYNRACKDLIHAKRKVELLSEECSEDARKVRSAMEREEMLRRVAVEEKVRYLEATREIDAAKQMLAQAALDRHKAEIKAIKESSEKLKIIDALFSSNRRCKRYSTEEIMAATDNFSDANKIGVGGYGNVYKCNLDHTPVAIKVLRQDATEKKDQFLREVEVLTQLNHPHMVLLLGVCPEMGCLVYDYMENGSLEDRLFCKDGTKPLSWATRFRIIFEVACGLVFLHGTKPDPIVHCDMKPGNILLDRNYMTKIGDVGLARLISNVAPDDITEYKDTLIAGSLNYMDPEYQRTGTLRPKSDLYAFGIVVLQVLTARHPLGLLVAVETAINSGTFTDILDKSITGWPLMESEKLAQIALRCSRLRCRDRPDLESEVIPEIEDILKVFDSRFKLNQSHVSAPSHYFCPILKQVMEEPYIAADGFTYEHRAIKAWLTRHNVSPVTKLKFDHNSIIPNHTLRSAIQEWKSHTEL